ncbi:unnamed protein product, partial [Scytosiphon promiscuus]
HSQRTPRRDVVFHVQHGSMVEKRKDYLATKFSSYGRETMQHGVGNGGDLFATSSTPSRLKWTTSNESVAPAFSPPPVNQPKGTWYEHADKVYRFFGFIVDQVSPTTRQAPANVRLVIILFYPQDKTLEMLESKETACPGVSRSFALRRPSRVSLDKIRVGADVLINGTRVHVYDADGFTRRSIPGMKPAELSPVPDKKFSITPRRGPTPMTQESTSVSDSCLQPAVRNRVSGGVGGTSATSFGACPSWDGGSNSALSQDPPGFLRMYIRWDESDSATGLTVHRYILHYFLEDETVEMRELADIKGGNYFEGRFPVMIRRQKVYAGGSSPSLSVDCIGGDHATTGSKSNTPRSARLCTGGSAGGVDCRGCDGDGDGVGQPLTPSDLCVGKEVLLMRRPMKVCGWDETAHVWWEKLTGTSMRELQGDLEDFQKCVLPVQSQPRRPNKPKSSFYEGPPQRPGTLRERFLKASGNSGKTLRFLAKATEDTKTTSTRDNVFIIRFYPEDDALSVYTSHNLGTNAGGLYKGVYLARRCDMINPDTGEPFKARDFHIGSVAKLPSVSLEIVDVDDFSRHYLARETSPSDQRWQTYLIWSKLLDTVTKGRAKTGATATAFNAASHHGWNRSSPRSPGKNVTFTGVDNGGAGGSPHTGDSALGSLSGRDDRNRPNGNNCLSASGALATDHEGRNACSDQSYRRSSVIFARLWAECVGDDTCAAFADDSCSMLSSMDENACVVDSTPSSQEEQQEQDKVHHAIPSLSKHQDAGPWERLIAALRNDRGIDISQIMSGHERTLLEREVADWLCRANGQDAQGLGPGKGMAERLASAAAVALHQDVTATGLELERSHDVAALPDGASLCAGTGGDERKTMGETMTAVSEATLGAGASNASPKRLSVGGLDFPAVVVEEPAMLPAHARRDRETNVNDAAIRPPSISAGGTREEMAGGQVAAPFQATPPKKLERELDLHGVALDAHEIPSTGRDDQIVQRALARVLAYVFSHGGETLVLRTLKAEGKTPGDVADLWTMCRLLKIVAELSRRETEGLWVKFMPAATAKAGEGGSVTFAGFLESIRAFEACLRRGEVLGLSSIGRNGNCAGPLVEE